jgi:hypothetical protein
MSEKAFYMVWRSCGFPPNFQHETLEAAREEAKRLATLHPGNEFFVLRVLEGWSYKPEPFVRRSFSHNKGE